MEERLDQLFREKLSNHKITPSADAWEKINTGLRQKRRPAAIWMAVAATVILIGVTGIFGYFYINEPESNLQTLVPESIPESQESRQNEDFEIHISENVESDPSLASNIEEQLPVIKEEPAIIEKPSQTSSKIQTETVDSQLATNTVASADVVLEAPTLSETTAIEVSEQEMLADIADVPQVDEQIAEESPQSREGQQKTYPKVTVIYRASADSPLIAQKNNHVFDKGIKEIARFSEKHIITDEVKSKLRNTKDDLLALNFGRIINKPNKDIEN